MKVTDVKTWVVGNPPPGIGGKYFIFVKLTTDGGVVGYGEAYNATFSAHVTAKMIEDMAERYLIGRDPHDIENLFRRVYSSGFTQRPDVSGMGCFSALEMACWDIIGKEAGKPAYKLLGGQVHETLRSYTYLYPHTGSVHSEDARGQNVYNDPDMAAACALEYVEQGFNAVKL
ncbi:MAG: mandelate racemase/muconate lactonizing enzyme family protein, partial [Mesorhizobium sp.]